MPLLMPALDGDVKKKPLTLKLGGRGSGRL